MYSNKRLKLIQEFLENEDDSSSNTDTDYSSPSEDISSDTDTSTEYVEQRKLTRITNIRTLIGKYDECEFKEHFRVEHATCNCIIDLLKCHNVLSSYKGDREHIKPDKATYVTLWYLANTEIFRQIPDQFGISKSTAHGVITTVVNFLVSQSRNYIIWPAGSKRIQTINKFKEKSGIHGIVVAIDGSHIQIKKPQTRHSHVYYNRNGYYSILLQAECDYDKKFIDVFCGEAGSMHDCRLLKKSSLYERGNSGMLGDDFLSGDSAYPSLDWLVPPFKDNGNLSQNQKDFNYRYSSTRIVIEHTFGILKGRFRRPRFFENDDILLVKCVIAATVLNNMCIMFNDTLDKCDMDMDNINNDQDNEQFVVSGVTRREYIFNIMD